MVDIRVREFEDLLTMYRDMGGEAKFGVAVVGYACVNEILPIMRDILRSPTVLQEEIMAEAEMALSVCGVVKATHTPIPEADDVVKIVTTLQGLKFNTIPEFDKLLDLYDKNSHLIPFRITVKGSYEGVLTLLGELFKLFPSFGEDEKQIVFDASDKLLKLCKGIYQPQIPKQAKTPKKKQVTKVPVAVKNKPVVKAAPVKQIAVVKGVTKKKIKPNTKNVITTDAPAKMTTKKKVLIGGVCVLTAAAIGFGLWKLVSPIKIPKQ